MMTGEFSLQENSPRVLRVFLNSFSAFPERRGTKYGVFYLIFWVGTRCCLLLKEESSIMRKYKDPQFASSMGCSLFLSCSFICFPIPAFDSCFLAFFFSLCLLHCFLFPYLFATLIQPHCATDIYSQLVQIHTSLYLLDPRVQVEYLNGSCSTRAPPDLTLSDDFSPPFPPTGALAFELYSTLPSSKL